ncbi:MAG: tripartite tricarboxylate transporter substrate binding protein [Aquisalimonadaceae bacterium]
MADYPDKPLRFYVGFPPGGSTDTVARIIGPALEKRMGQTVVLDNRAGGGGYVGLEAVSRADPDGHTFGFGVSGALTVAPTLRDDLSIDPHTDLVPVSGAVINPLVLAVHKDKGINTLQEYIDAAREQGGMTYGTAGPGTAMHLAGELLAKMTETDLTHIGYRGNGPAMSDVLGGHVDSVILDVTTLKPHVEEGTLVALGVTSPQRTELAPDYPTFQESGVDGYDVSSWFGVLTTAGTPPDVVAKLNEHIVAVLKDPEVSRRLLEAGLEPAPSTPEEFKTMIMSQFTTYAELIKSADLGGN